jgi:hypothetical protein
MQEEACNNRIRTKQLSNLSGLVMVECRRVLPGCGGRAPRSFDKAAAESQPDEDDSPSILFKY